MRAVLRLIVLGVAAMLVQTARADTVELKNGTIVDGKYTGGTATTLRLETPQGVQVLQTVDVLALTFTSGAAAAPPPATDPAAPPQPVAAAAAAAAPPVAPAAVTVPAGTVLTIRMDSPVSSKDPAGKKFTGKLLADLMAGNAVVAKAGTTVHGQVDQSKQAGRLAGKSQLAISLTGIDLAGKVVPIMTTNFAEAGKGEFRKTARNVAAGALIGEAADDDAGKGAAIGAGVSLIKKGDAVTVPPGALLEFRLSQPLQTTVP